MIPATRSRAYVRAPLCAAILFASAQLGFEVDAATVASANIGHARVILPPGVLRDGEAGVALLHDYGAFRLYRVDAAHAKALSGAEATAGNTIEFNAMPLDTAGTPPVLPADFRTGATSGPRLQIVQFIGPIAREWIDGVNRTGARIVQYIPNNAYVVLADDAAIATLDAQAHAGTEIQYSGAYAPYFKLGASIAERVNRGLSAARNLDITVQVVSWSGNGASKGVIEQLAGTTAHGAWQNLAGVEALTFNASETDIATLAQMRDVFAIEEYVAPRLLDEVQDQIVAGNLSADRTGPSAPGYFSFLTGLGFSTNPADYPIVDVADDGIGNGSTVNGAGDPMLTQNGDGTTTRIMAVFNCTGTAAPHGQDGHGHLNTGIVGGYDNRSGFPYVDPLGYLRGLGINPYARLSHTKIFADGGTFNISRCGNSDAGVTMQENLNGALISSNSWGAAVGGAYNSDSRAYDISTRDSNSSAGGSQPMIFVFAAGNSGPGTATVGSPGTAKNVITVGASENKRPSDEDGNWTDGCGIGPTGADNAMDVISFSSRGPAAGNRIKPEVIAPGTHIQAGASPYSGYDGSGVCDQYHPSGQTTFAASSGTSHSTPAVSGVVSLLYRWLQTQYADSAPSAAIAKAYLMASPTYLTGVGANDNLPSNKQGYGMPNIGSLFDATTARVVVDQTQILTATGQTYVWTGNVADTSKPLRIAMAYSDAPGATTGNPQVNNLDLSVQVGSSTYLGNHFTGQWSTTGGSADTANNYEAVFLQSGTSGSITITVTAANIAGDGVPGNADTTDQDFALVCSNCTQVVNNPPVANADSYSTNENTPLNVSAPGVLGNDSDPDGDPLTAAVVATVAHGTLTLNSNGSFAYTPTTNYFGSDSFTYQAHDNHGGISNTATVSLTVNHVNQAPVATDDSYSTNEDTPLNVSAPGVLGNDTDADGDALTAALVAGPAHGNVTLNTDGSFAYTPNNGYSGNDSFTYQANDGQLDSNVATVTITVNHVNQAPVANDDSYSVNENTEIVLDPPGVLANDSDPDGDPMTAVLVSGVAHGALTLDGTGGFNYTPDPGYFGPDSFTYQAHDNHGGISNTATVSLTVVHVNQAPTANGDAISVIQGGTATTLVGGATSVLANDTDPDGDTLTASVVALPTHGTLTLNADGTFSYTDDGSNANGDSFQYQACDPSLACSTATVTITIDLSPTISCMWPTLTYSEGDAVDLGLAALFSDPEGQPLTYSASGAPPSLALDTTSGMLSGTLALGDSLGSPYTIVAGAQDPGGASVSESVTFIVLQEGERVFDNNFETAGAPPPCVP